MKDTFAIIIPCYNEQDRLQSMWAEFMNYVKQIEKQVILSVIFVDDGSKDQTLTILQDIKNIAPIPVTIIHYEENQGKGYALKKGVMSIDVDYYLIMDADGATDMKEILHFVEYRKRADIVIGNRVSELAYRPWYKKILGFVSHIIITKTLGLQVADTQCGFKIFSHKVKNLWKEMVLDKWGFDFELLFLAKKYGYHIQEYDIVRHDIAGSKVGIGDYIKTLKDLYIVYSLHSKKCKK